MNMSLSYSPDDMYLYVGVVVAALGIAGIVLSSLALSDEEEKANTNLNTAGLLIAIAALVAGAAFAYGWSQGSFMGTSLMGGKHYSRPAPMPMRRTGGIF